MEESVISFRCMDFFFFNEAFIFRAVSGSQKVKFWGTILKIDLPTDVRFFKDNS